MEIIYSNFDGLDMSFQCFIPEWILETLLKTKEDAQKMRQEAVARLGKNQIPVLVGETGAKGGFTYRFDTGFHGETWFIVHSKKRDGWNVKVSVKSVTMALYGYEGVKDKILNFLTNDLEAKGPIRKNNYDEIIETPLERISRVDYCIDFKTAHFLPVADCFVAGGRFKKHLLLTHETNKETATIIFEGRNVKYFRIGTMPNRQIVLYDKISDITDKKKNYWWEIWGINKSEFKGKIWRLEIRAGKKELNKWNLRRFNDFESKIGNVISSTLKDIKYTIPSETDKNITRWPLALFWKQAIDISEERLESYISDAKRKLIIEGHRRALMSQMEKLILGSTLSYAALYGMDISEIPAVLDILGEVIIQNVKENPAKYIKKHQDSVDKYAELNG